MLRSLISRGYNNLNIAIIGAGRIGMALCGAIKAKPYLGLKILGFMDDKCELTKIAPFLGKVGDFENICKRHFINEIFITIPLEADVLSKIIKFSKKNDVNVCVIPDNFEDMEVPVRTSNIDFIPILTYEKKTRSPIGMVVKEIFDFIGASLLILILSPLFFITALMIKIDSRGPVFYSQKRAGKQGKIFNCYKFRSMVENAQELKADLLNKNEISGGVIFKIKDDPRITRIGKILRRYSIDELPQLFNVLAGDMSLVGPRPFDVEEIKKMDDDHMTRLNVKPGITGLAQVKGRSNIAFRRWIKWDIWYVNNRSFMIDLLILLWTIPAVFKKEGAY